VTQSAIARELGIPQPLISWIERERIRLPRDFTREYREALEAAKGEE
jgi:hypothetical protein